MRPAACRRARRPLYSAHVELPAHQHRGPIGVGKSALAEHLAGRLDAALVLEERENPFLADFYAERPGAALQAQLFYLLARHRQQGRAATGRPVQPAHDRRLPLRPRQDLRVPQSGRQRAVHLPAAVRAAGARRQPARSGHLPAGAHGRAAQAPAGTSARHRRGATRSIPDATYLQELNEAYQHFFFHYSASPLLVVETSSFGSRPTDAIVDDLIRQIEGMTGEDAVLRAAEPESSADAARPAARHALSRSAQRSPPAPRVAPRTALCNCNLQLTCSTLPPAWRGSRKAASPSRPSRKRAARSRRACG